MLWQLKKLGSLSALIAGSALAMCLALAALFGEFNRTAIGNLCIFAALLLGVLAIFSSGAFRLGLTNPMDPMYAGRFETEPMAIDAERRAGVLKKGIGERFAMMIVFLTAAALLLMVSAFVGEAN